MKTNQLKIFLVNNKLFFVSLFLPLFTPADEKYIERGGAFHSRKIIIK